MKQLNFNEKKILKSLLDKTKTTTIRKAWDIIEKEPNIYTKAWRCDKGKYSIMIEKLCKYKVGEIVEAVWTKVRKGLPFLLLDKVKITKIEKIEIVKSKSGTCWISKNDKHWSNKQIVSLAESEGFKNPEEMFSYLEKYAGDLTKAKPFWLIEFKWRQK